MKSCYNNWPMCRCRLSLLNSLTFSKLVSNLFYNEGRGGEKLDTCLILM